MKNLYGFFIALIALGFGILITFLYLNYNKDVKVSEDDTISYVQPKTNTTDQSTVGQTIDLRKAANLSVKSVVHVKTQYTQLAIYKNPLFEFFYGQAPAAKSRKVQAAGSGVIISEDGYIITNNHVIDKSEKIVVVLNDNREFPAELIGTDPNTDLALIKIEAANIEAIKFADSDKVSLGAWVLAVGNPYNLTSTVTAGIVSAKGRSISDPRKKKLSLEAFIQTDAAVNPGNSGGALVNTNGELVGINTAIQSSTGSYIGYSFAIPSNIVSKVANDLKEFGSVQRGYLGVQIATVTSELAKKLDLDKVEGVMILEVTNGGAAETAGLQSKDVIIAINKIKVNSVEQLQEQLAKYSPNDDLTISVKREGLVKHFSIQLRNTIGGKNNTENIILGAELQPISDEVQRALYIKGGVIVAQLGEGKLQEAGVREGFIILSINNVMIETISDVHQALEDDVLQGKFLLEGIYPNGKKAYYRFINE